jgi:hypothetical protein
VDHRGVFHCGPVLRILSIEVAYFGTSSRARLTPPFGRPSVPQGTQFPAVPHLAAAFLCSDKIGKPGITFGCLDSPHLAGILPEFTDELPEPFVADAKLVCPGTSRRLATSRCKP